MKYGVVDVATKRGLRGAVFVMAGFASALQAAEWQREAGISPELTYTDNVCLSATDEQGEWIGLLTPDITLIGTGSRANLDLYAALQMNTLSDSRLEELGCTPSITGNRKQVAPRLRARGDVVIKDDWVFLDGNASISQNSVNAFAPGGNDSLDRTGNTNTTYRYSLSPYVAHRFKQTAEFILRYTWDDQYNTKTAIGNSSRERVELGAGAVPGGSKILWGVQANYDNIDYKDSAGGQSRGNSELSSAQVNLGYQLNRDWQVNGYYGREKNNFVSAFDEIDGYFWDVGLRWTPNTRTTVDVGTGDRFFGTTPRLTIRYRHKRSRFSAKYARTLTYDRNIRTLNNEVGQPVDPSLGEPTTITNSPILDDRFTLGYSYRGRRTGFNLTATHSDQTRAQDGRDSTFMSASLAADRRLSRQFSLLFSLRWDETDPRGERSDRVFYSETWRAKIGARRSLSQNLNMTLDYQYTDRYSDSEARRTTYEENRITLHFRYNI